jgi:carbon starvation protein CstA
VNTLWVVLGLGFAGAVVALFASWRKGEHAEDMGTVSHQWIAEHRLGSSQDSRR